MYHIYLDKHVPLNEARLRTTNNPFLLLFSYLLLHCYEDNECSSENLILSELLASKLPSQLVNNLETLPKSNINAESIVLAPVSHFWLGTISSEQISQIIHRQFYSFPVTEGIVLPVLLKCNCILMKVIKVIPEGSVSIVSTSKISLKASFLHEENLSISHIVYQREYDLLLSWLQECTKSYLPKWTYYARLGCIVSGPMGIGKTNLIQ
jgi:hypothetical protein